MDKFVVDGGVPLFGSIDIGGSKNSALPLLFAALLSDEPARLSNVPRLRDIDSTLMLFSEWGVDYAHTGHRTHIRSTRLARQTASYDVVRKMRASILALGPLLARHGYARVSLPGGCAIGLRPIDVHLQGFKKMGVDIRVENGYVEARCQRLRGAVLDLRKPSVTGTENLLMAATLADGETLIRNAAREPEIVDLAQALGAMGAKISGAGSPVIRVRGTQALTGMDHRVMPDRIETGTYLAAVAACGGKVVLRQANKEDLKEILPPFEKGGLRCGQSAAGLAVEMKGRFSAVNVKTAPYPGFPTDLQAQIMAVNCLAEGTATITETVFENRFMHIQELQRMGADIQCADHVATVRGRETLTGASVMATDLRASASLVIAALAARGRTTINRIYHLDRGYENMERKLRKLGAKIRRFRN